MNPPRRPSRRAASRRPRRGASAQAAPSFGPAPPGSQEWPEPWVSLRSVAYHPHLFRRMVASASPAARPGDVVAVYDRRGERFGSAFYNPHSQIALRMLAFDDRLIDGSFFRDALQAATDLRRDTLGLDEHTDAYRVVNSEGDGLSGLVADRFGDVLSVEVFSLGVYRRLGELVPSLHDLCGTTRHRVRVDALVARREGFEPDGPEEASADAPPLVRILENGVRFSVDFTGGHKTGFFCDQRENRLRLAGLVKGASVLDLCCYTGGFAVYAKTLGGADEVTGVDLDEAAIEQARRNANLNQVRVRWVHADAFAYARQMLQNGREWPVVVLDPPKFIGTRADMDEGRRKYHDLNRLALSLVAARGLFVTCSCSGLLSRGELESIVVQTAHRSGRRLQLLWATGASPDHPVMSNCPEGRYLKVLWWRAL